MAQCDRGYFNERGGQLCEPCLHTCLKCVAKTNCTECHQGLQVYREKNMRGDDEYFDKLSVLLNHFSYKVANAVQLVPQAIIVIKVYVCDVI